MVALAQWIEEKEPDVVAENRVWDFLGESPNRVRRTPVQVADCDWEITVRCYDWRRGPSLAQSQQIANAFILQNPSAADLAAAAQRNAGSRLRDPIWQSSLAHKEVLAVSEFAGDHQRGTWGNKIYRNYSKAEMREIAFRETRYIKYGKNAVRGVKIVGFALDGYAIASAKPGEQRHDAIASAAGSTVGALGGAAIGSAIGNLPGAIIGGFIGGFGGSFLKAEHLLKTVPNDGYEDGLWL